VLICTEAGAKGLNLQFCNTVINYDLPWNPQRIEQRIGRCHRYSQEHDVTVVNFIARDNEAHQLTFEILSQKLDLFGKVLDASDTVLHEPRTDAPELVVSALSVELESDLRNIYSRSRTLDEVTREIAALRDKITEKRVVYEREYQRTSQIIESRFDEKVRKVFKSLREELPHGLADLDRDVAALVDGYLTARSVKYRRSEETGRAVFEIAPDGVLPAEIGEGRRFATGDARALKDAEALNLAHPLVRAAIADARNWHGGSLIFELPPHPPAELTTLVGGAGHLRVALVGYEGFEPVQRLVAAAVLDGKPIDPIIAKGLIHLSTREGSGGSLAGDPGLLTDALDEAVFVDQREIEKGEQKHFEQAIRQLERFVEDKILVLRRELSSISEKLRSAKQRRDQVVGSTARERIEAEIEELATREENLESRIGALESREDEVYTKWRDHYHKLRYQPPNVEVLFDAAFQIAPANQGRSC
jgi:predicted  nucleic acid-binding Zn-ribbon protein